MESSVLLWPIERNQKNRVSDRIFLVALNCKRCERSHESRSLDGRSTSFNGLRDGRCGAWTLEGLCETQIPPVSSGDVALAISNELIAYNIAFKLYTLVLFQLSHLSTPSSLLLVGSVLEYCCY